MLLAALDLLAHGGARGPRILFPLLMLLLFGLVIGWLIRRRRGGSLRGHAYGSPMQTLQERFARGEIDRAEFEHRKAVLVGADVVPPAPDSSTPSEPEEFTD